MPEFSGNLVLSAFLSVLLGAYDKSLGWPCKSRIDVATLAAARALPFVWIMERTADGRYRYRLTGEEVRANFGRQVRDALVEEVVEPENARDISRLYSTVLDERSVCYSRGPTIGRIHAYVAERILVPACDDAGRPVFVVSCFQRRDVSFAENAAGRVHFTIQTTRFCPLGELIG